MMKLSHAFAIILSAVTLPGCTSDPADGMDQQVYDRIGEDEGISLLGTEPFWSMEIRGSSLVYSTPENPDGDRIAVTRFAGNGGIGITGIIADAPLQVAVTPGECSDAMSDRIYPFTATVSLGEETLLGCGYTPSMPFSGEPTP
jgi:uncharacterized membrane protein